MVHPTETFRARYRAAISRHYHPWLHAGFVLAYGIFCITLAWSTTAAITPLQWLTVPLTLADQETVLVVIVVGAGFGAFDQAGVGAQVGQGQTAAGR